MYVCTNGLQLLITLYANRLTYRVDVAIKDLLRQLLLARGMIMQRSGLYIYDSVCMQYIHRQYP